MSGTGHELLDFGRWVERFQSDEITERSLRVVLVAEQQHTAKRSRIGIPRRHLDGLVEPGKRTVDELRLLRRVLHRYGDKAQHPAAVGERFGLRRIERGGLIKGLKCAERVRRETVATLL